MDRQLVVGSTVALNGCVMKYGYMRWSCMQPTAQIIQLLCCMQRNTFTYTVTFSRLDNTAIPHPLILWRNFWVMYAINDVLFYIGHRCLHSKFCYAPIHKMHHSFIGTEAIAAEYCACATPRRSACIDRHNSCRLLHV